jgi:hypothetical protein
MITIRDPKGSPAPESYQYRVEATGNLAKWGHPGFESRM